METPAGWYEVIRGPRPPSVKWPLARPKQVIPRRGRWRGARTVVDSKGATVPSVPPDIAREGARNRVSQLQTAIAAFGSYDGPEMTMLREAMKRAQRAAQEPPISNQIKECEEFIAREEKRLVLHDHYRTKLASDLEDGRNRLQHLRTVAEATLQTPGPVPQAPPDWGAQIRSLQQMVNQLQEERDALMCVTGQSPPKKPQSREEPVFATDTGSHRCQDIVDEGAAGRVGGGHSPGSASRGVPIDSRDGGSDQSLVSEADVATFHGGERRFCVRIWDRIVQHQCGSFGVLSRRSVKPGPCNHSPGPETGEADTN